MYTCCFCVNVHLHLCFVTKMYTVRHLGCVGVLQLMGDRLYQSPLPEIDALRTK
jgi:hypothetical protein